ncbi:MAG: TVP38/TMEM64 family protein [Coriobacteriia bacterium]|nr:TVP38/TMEM64 family protein [Coriobacteriia bacterium]
MQGKGFFDSARVAWANFRNKSKKFSRYSRRTFKNYTKHPLNRRQIRNLILFILIVIAVTLVAYYAFQPILQFMKDPSSVKAWVDENPTTAVPAFIGLMMVQIIIAILPGEPIQLAMGYAFGWFWGSIYTLLATIISAALIFTLVRKFGRPIVNMFFSEEKLEEISWLHESKQINTLMFILMLIPGTPKDLFTYIAGLTKMKLHQWLLITLVARIPGVIAQSIAGANLGTDTWHISLIAFGVTGLFALLGIAYYAYLTKQVRNKKHMDRMRMHYRQVSAMRNAREQAQKTLDAGNQENETNDTPS